uniref:Ig-like domain-containing protein n=1 Tax=Photobacterium piscicola TaxID=1378299 RepID=UPI003735B293
IPVHGTVGDDVKVGDTVTVTVGSQTYTTTVQTGNTWTVNVPGKVLVDNSGHDVHATVTATDEAGNSIVANAEHPYSVKTLDASITINNITTDNVINETEAKEEQIVSGSVGGGVKENDIVTITIDGHVYHTNVITKDGKLIWEVNIPGKILSQANVDQIHASVTATDTAGNVTVANADHSYLVATLDVSITVDSINKGEAITGAEYDNNTPIQVTGSVGGNAKVGDEITLNLGNNTVKAEVIELADGKLGYVANVPGSYFEPNTNDGFSGDINATITIHDIYQNIASSEASENYNAEGDVIISTPSSDVIDGTGYNDVIVGDSIVEQPQINVNLVLDTSGSMAEVIIDPTNVHLNNGFTSGDIINSDGSVYLHFDTVKDLTDYYSVQSLDFLNILLGAYGTLRFSDGSIQKLTAEDLHPSTRIEQAVDAIRDISDHYSHQLDHAQLSKMEFSLITFAVAIENNEKFHWDFDKKIFVTNSGTTLDSVLDHVVAYGATNDFNTAIAEGVNSFTDNGGTNIIYFVSDGLDGSTNLDTIKSLTGDNLEKLDPIIIPTLIGSDVTDVIPTEVKDIASLGDGYLSNNEGASQVIIVKDITGLAGELNNNFDHIISGADTIHGGAGNDLIIGDTLNIAWLLEQYGSDEAHLHDLLDNGTSIKDILYSVVSKSENVENPTTENIYHYIETNQQQLVINNPEQHGGGDKIFGESGNDIIFGSSGHDILTGGTGDDLLFGQNGNDILVSDAGNDILWGGNGADIFKLDLLNNNENTITVIKDIDSQDKLDLSSILNNDSSVDNILKHVTSAVIDNNNVTLTIDNNTAQHKVELNGITDVYHDLGSSTTDIVTSLFNHHVFTPDSH